MTEIRLEDLNLENVGVIADLSNWTLSDEEDDDNDSYKKELDDELNKIKDVIKRHPLPPVDENEEFWKDVINRFRDNNHYILSGAIRKLNTEDSLVDGQMRIIEFWWDGIGGWKA